MKRILVVTDREAYEANQIAEQVRHFLRVLDDDEPEWDVVTGDAFTTVKDLLDIVEERRPDLICTYRHLHSEGWRWPFTLGDHVAVLTQATGTPVLLLPHPSAGRESAHALENTDRVMAITSHLPGDDVLVNAGVRFTQAGGTLFLTHVEDEVTFERYIEVIGRIPDLDTVIARETIRDQLLRRPRQFIDQCRTVLADQGERLTVEPIVILGNRLAQYKALIDSHEVDLLVMHTKDDQQLAMHGMAYPLAVEMRHIPLLLL